MNILLDVQSVNTVWVAIAGGEFLRRLTDDNAEASRILLGLLDAVDQDGGQSQRHLASELGIALGLVNAYLKRCVKKGLVKVRQAPARRYAYYLTPQGFAEKSRLTVEYLSYSLSFFRRARGDCAMVVALAAQRGWKRIALAGVSDLGEIATICALECGLEIVAVIDPSSDRERFVNLPVLQSLHSLIDNIDGVIVTDMLSSQMTFVTIGNEIGWNRVLAPSVLGIDSRSLRGVSQ